MGGGQIGQLVACAGGTVEADDVPGRLQVEAFAVCGLHRGRVDQEFIGSGEGGDGQGGRTASPHAPKVRLPFSTSERSVRRIGPGGLRLDDQEVDRVLREIAPDLAPWRRVELADRIDGWPAGLDMVGRILATGQPVTGPALHPRPAAKPRARTTAGGQATRAALAAGQGRYDEAVNQAAEIDDWFAVVDLVLETGLDIIGCGRAGALISWLDQLPAEVVMAESGAAVLAAMAFWVRDGDVAADDIDRRSRRGRKRHALGRHGPHRNRACLLPRRRAPGGQTSPDRRAALAAGDHQRSLELALRTTGTARLVPFRVLGQLDAANFHSEQGRADRSMRCLAEVDRLLDGHVDVGRLISRRRRAIERQIKLGREARWSNIDLLSIRPSTSTERSTGGETVRTGLYRVTYNHPG